ncbi:MAG TPA: ABC transporter substrate-binding protein [Dehalococcoidia bacterium]|nr:ABC transporter substrate-binding protein [Dehalococcoidia bacterium]
MAEYWDKFWRKRISRRRLMTGTALAGSGLAVGSVIGCGGESTSNNNGTGNGTGSSSDSGNVLEQLEKYNPVPNDARREMKWPQDDKGRGNTLVYIGFDPVVLDRYDPHQTQFGPMYANQSAVFSKLYMYKSHEVPTHDNIVPDLATLQPETPDELTYIVKLRKGVKFHNTDKIRSNFPNLAGRELTADDVIYSYKRQVNQDSPQRAYYYRSSQYDTIDKMEKIDNYTIRITTKAPTAPFRHFMADTNAMIIPPEIVDMEPGPTGKPWDSVDAFGDRTPRPGDRMIGTGPFMWDNLQFGIEYVAKRNPEWYGWDDPSLGRPFLDAYKATGQGLNDVTIQSLFERKEIDVAGFVDNPSWIPDFFNAHAGELEYIRGTVSGWLNSRFKMNCKPFDDWKVRRALYLVVDRQQIVDVIGSSTWVKCGPIGPAIAYWALPDSELLALPGYRTDQAGRDQDKQDARQLYEAAGKPDLPLIWFADVPDYIGRYADSYIQGIKQTLGIDSEIKFQKVPYSRIAEGLIKEECDQGAMTWGYDNGWIDLDDWFYPYFKTGGPKNSFRVSDPDLDKLLDAQRAEFDIDKRKQLGYEIQRYLLGMPKQDSPAAHARIDYAAPGGGSIAWNYLKNRVTFPWFGNSQWTANVWIDQNDPTYSGRTT